MSRLFDVIVVGGGAAGACTAALMATGSRRVGLLDIRTPQRPDAEKDIDPRVAAISPGSRNILIAAGAWPLLDGKRIGSYDRMRVVSGRHSIDFRASDHGLSQLGWILEIPAVERALWDALEARGQVEFLTGHRLASMGSRAGELRLHLDDGSRVDTRLLVAADGGQSRVRREAGIETDTWHYNQSAIVAHLETEQPNQGLAWQRFTDSGPLALLPLPGGRSSLVWSVPAQMAAELTSGAEEQFLETVYAAAGESFGRITGTSRRMSFPLVRRQARSLTAPGLALVGDAARTVHPLAGQGLNLGLADAAALAEEFEPWRPGGDTAAPLQRYKRWRTSSGSLLAGGIHGINELFNSSLPGLKNLAGVGMTLSGFAWPVRDAFARRAAGMDGDSPRIARTPDPEATGDVEGKPGPGTGP